MNEIDPYSSPQSDPSAQIATDSRLKDLDFQRLKKLYHRSCNVNAITFLIVVGLIALVAALIPLISISSDDDSKLPWLSAFIGLALFYMVAIAGLYKRTSWGKIMGIIICIMSLISIPIGTAIGIFGLFAFFGAPELFGPDRLTHKELKAEFKSQKAILKAR